MALGEIRTALADSLTILSTCNEVRGDICHAIGDFFAVVYHEDTTANTILSTSSMTVTGVIPAAVQSSLTIDTDGACSGPRPSIIKVADGIVAVAYDDGAACVGPIVKTFSVDSSGDLDACDPIDSLDLSTGTASPTITIHATSTASLFCALYYDACGDLQAATFTIDGCGNISTKLDEQEIDAGPATDMQSDMVWTGIGDYHVFAWTDTSSNDGFLETWTIDSCGNFGCAAADTHEFQTSNAERVSVNSNDNGTLLLFYEGPSCGGDVLTVTVDACGVMANGIKLDTHAIANDTTDLLRLDDAEDKNVFLGVANSQLTSWIVDGCDVPTEVDSLASTSEVDQHGRLALKVGQNNLVAGCGYDSCAAAFIVFSLEVISNTGCGDVPIVADSVDSAFTNSRGIVWTSATVGYAIFANNDQVFYSKTITGAETWTTAVAITSLISSHDVFDYSIWYDNWTTGDTGTKIHVVAMHKSNSANTGSALYRNLDTSTDTLSSLITLDSAIGMSAPSKSMYHYQNQVGLFIPLDRCT